MKLSAIGYQYFGLPGAKRRASSLRCDITEQRADPRPNNKNRRTAPVVPFPDSMLAWYKS
jgi:hypothetical protein